MANRKQLDKRRALVILALLLWIPALASCGINRELAGVWQLIDAGGTAFSPDTRFEFRKDRELLISPNQAGLSLSYSSSPNGDLSITSKGPGTATKTQKMTYTLSGDRLAITDEEGLTLVFRRLSPPAP